MRLARPVLLVSLVAAAAVVVPAGASPRVGALGAPAVPVTGHELTSAGYERLGLDARSAALHRQLDHFAARGVDVHLLNTALASSSATASTPLAEDDLVDVGNLDGSGPVELAEERYVTGKPGQTLQLVVRNGLTGAPLWTRTDSVTGKKLIFAFGAPVGAANRPGVLVWVFDAATGTWTVTALDGRGHQVWGGPLTPPTAVAPTTLPQVGVTTSSGSSYRVSLFDVGVALRPGPLDIAMMQVDDEVSSGDLGTSQSGAVAFSAVSLANGAGRALPGGTSSSSGTVAGDVVDDADGDGYVDLVTVDGGSHVVTVLRAKDGSTVWSRSDAFSGDLLNGHGVPSVLGEKAGRHLAEDLVLITRPSAGPLDPVLGSGDRTPTVTLLGGHTGRTAWTKPGTDAYALETAPGRGLGVLDDRSSATSSTATAAVAITVYDVAGRTRWTRSFSMSQPVSGWSATYVAWGLLDDFDRDGALEGLVALGVDTDSGESKHDYLLRGKDGATLAPLTAAPLGGAIRRGHHDLASLSSSSGGLVLTVLDAMTRARLLRTTVPGSRGTTAGYVYADDVSRHPCDDLLVSGGGQSRTVVAVLASSGAARWSVSRTGSDTRLGTVVRPARAPAVSC